MSVTHPMCAQSYCIALITAVGIDSQPPVINLNGMPPTRVVPNSLAIGGRKREHMPSIPATHPRYTIPLVPHNPLYSTMQMSCTMFQFSTYNITAHTIALYPIHLGHPSPATHPDNSSYHSIASHPSRSPISSTHPTNSSYHNIASHPSRSPISRHSSRLVRTKIN